MITSTLETSTTIDDRVNAARNWTPFGRAAGAVCLIGGSIGWLAGELIGFGKDGPDLVSFEREHPTLAGIGLAADLIGTILILGAVVVWFLLARQRSPRLARAGAALLGVALIAQGVVCGVEISQFALAVDGHVDMSAVATALASPSQMGIAGYVFAPLWFVAPLAGIVLMMVALWRSRTLARAAIVLVVAFQLVQIFGVFPGTVLLTVGMCWMAVSVLIAGRTRRASGVAGS